MSKSFLGRRKDGLAELPKQKYTRRNWHWSQLPPNILPCGGLTTARRNWYWSQLGPSVGGVGSPTLPTLPYPSTRLALSRLTLLYCTVR
jgi:hypothetical protein